MEMLGNIWYWTEKAQSFYDCNFLNFFTGVRKVLKNGNKEMYDLEKKINDAVFPGLQGGPHNNKIGGEITVKLEFYFFCLNKRQTHLSAAKL